MTTDPMDGYIPIEHFQETDDDHSAVRIRDMPYGKRRESLAIYPTELIFQSTSVSQPSPPYPIMITNDGYDVVVISKIKIVGDFTLSGDITTLLPGQHASLSVVFTPQRNGVSTGGIYLDSGNAAGEEFIFLSGTGFAGAVPDINQALITSTNSIAIPAETYSLADWMQYVAPLTLNVQSTGRWGLNNAGGLYVYQDLLSSHGRNYGAASRTEARFNYTGGTGGEMGTVYSTAQIDTYASAGVKDNIWGINCVLYNSTTAVGENVAGAFTGIKKPGGYHTWAGLFNVQEERNPASGVPTSGTIAVEMGLYANGPDGPGGTRVLLHLAYNKQNPAWAEPEIARGIHIGPQTDGVGILKTAIQLDGRGEYGIDMSRSTYSSAVAVKMPDAADIAWNSDTYRIGVHSGAFVYMVAGVNAMTLGNTGNLGINGMLTSNVNVGSAIGGASSPGIRMGTGAIYCIHYGSGPPTITGTKGSIYMRNDGTGPNNRMYINIDGASLWTALVTVA